MRCLNVCRVFDLQSVAVGSFRVVVIVVLSVVGSVNANTSVIAKQRIRVSAELKSCHIFTKLEPEQEQGTKNEYAA